MDLAEQEDGKYEELNNLAHKNKSEIDDAELTEYVEKALERKYQFPEWALFFEVVSPEKKRVDAVAYNMFPGRNFKTIALEIKVSRGDWKKEKANPRKNDYFVGQADEFYIVAGRKGIVKEDELPEGWGLMEMKGGGKLYKVKESNLSGSQNRPMDKEFYSRAVKNAAEEARKERRSKERAVEEAFRDGREKAKEELNVTEEYEKLQQKAETLDDLADKLNVNLLNYSNQLNNDKVEKLNKAVELVNHINGRGWSDIMTKVENAEKLGEELIEKSSELRKSVQEFDELIDPDTQLNKGLQKFNEEDD
jgi:hypothetical protein